MGTKIIDNVLKENFDIPETVSSSDILCSEVLLKEMNRYLRKNLKNNEAYFKTVGGKKVFDPVTACTEKSYQNFLIYRKQREICRSGICKNGKFCGVLKNNLSLYSDFPFLKIIARYRPLLAFEDVTCTVRMGFLERNELRRRFEQRNFRAIVRPYEKKYGSFDTWNYNMVRYFENHVLNRERREKKRRKK